MRTELESNRVGRRAGGSVERPIRRQHLVSMRKQAAGCRPFLGVASPHPRGVGGKHPEKHLRAAELRLSMGLGLELELKLTAPPGRVGR